MRDIMQDATTATSDREQIAVLERQRAQAVLDQDYAEFVRLSHAELRYVHSSGVVDTRDSYVDSCRAGLYSYQDIRLPAEEIIVGGDTAVILGRMEASLTVDGRDKELDYPSIAVWTREAGQWRFLAFSPRTTGQE